MKAINVVIFALFLYAQFIAFPVYSESTLSDSEAHVVADGYSYVYQSIPVRDPAMKEAKDYTGKIVISRVIDQRVVYEEHTTQQPGLCDGFPSISKLQFKIPVSRLLGGDPEKYRTLVVLCGSYSGRHQTLKVFFADPIMLKVATLQMDDTRPNLDDADGDGIYTSRVYRRIMFDDLDKIKMRRTPYLFVYALHIDSSSFGFVPLFGQTVKRDYLDYFKELNAASKTAIDPEYVGPMIGALFATNDKDIICKEVFALEKKSVSLAVVSEWATRIQNAGYPNFDLNVCKER